MAWEDAFNNIADRLADTQERLFRERDRSAAAESRASTMERDLKEARRDAACWQARAISAEAALKTLGSQPEVGAPLAEPPAPDATSDLPF